MENNLIKQQRNSGFEWFIASDSILNHWQNHRRQTRQIIESFPEDKLFKFSVGGMRSFSTMVKEVMCIADSGIQDLFQDKPVSESGCYSEMTFANTKEEILNLWDDVTYKIDTLWPLIPQQRFHQVRVVFEGNEKTTSEIILSWIGNEIHHRGQGCVYLRFLGIELPAFFNRC